MLTSFLAVDDDGLRGRGGMSTQILSAGKSHIIGSTTVSASQPCSTIGEVVGPHGGHFMRLYWREPSNHSSAMIAQSIGTTSVFSVFS